MARQQFISYLRVSTDRQGRSGLGLEAQREAVRRYIESHTQGGTLAAEYVEVESGRKAQRPQLYAALTHAKRANAAVIVAKLDRLSRNARFLLGIVDSGANVVFCDLPQIPAGPMNRLMLTLLAGVAEFEAGLISQRTKAALDAAKARGVKLGNPNGAAALRRYHRARLRARLPHPTGAAKATAARQLQANERALAAARSIASLQTQGITSRRALAEVLNAQQVTAPRGGKWHPNGIARLLKRLRAVAL